MIDMRLIVTGGGTGGHIYPGLAVARELLSRPGDHEVIYVGSARGLEAKLLAVEEIEFFGLKVAGIKGSGLVRAGWSMILLLAAIAESLKLLIKRKPDAVLGVGGYASGAMGLAALLSGTPLAIAEQNANPGLTNRWLGRFARKVFLAWPGSEKSFPKGRGIVTGNPVRSEFFTVNRKGELKLLNILIIGGSQGAKSINNAMAQAAPLLDPMADKIALVHQTGQRDLEMMKTIYKNSRFNCEAHAFLNDMPQRLADADLVISRSGAGAVFEICAVGRGAIYVPFPYAADDHQRKNAETVTATGGALLVDDSELDGKMIVRLVKRYLESNDGLLQMGARAGKLAKPGAASLIVDELLKMEGVAA